MSTARSSQFSPFLNQSVAFLPDTYATIFKVCTTLFVGISGVLQSLQNTLPCQQRPSASPTTSLKTALPVPDAVF
eukprot:2481841-Prorocentrum_lima.AAC.1